MENNYEVCCHCGSVIETDDYDTINGEPTCEDCAREYCHTCDDCGELMFDEDCWGDDDRCLCRNCYENHYTRCDECDSLLPNENVYNYDGQELCQECYHDKCRSIYPYSYKPTPIFYGKGKRFLGVELEIDIAGTDDDNAQKILDIANYCNDHIYIKSDGSLDDGMEIVTHPMSLEYHLNEFCWDDILDCAVDLGYRSHQTKTCGLHIHVNRDSLGDDYDQREETVSKILYFVEHHWAEMLKFSRRSQSAMNRWAARYGYESSPKKILDKAKETYGRYTAVNLNNCHTIEFRLFRGTLKLNTLHATLQMVNHICDVAMRLSDDELASLSWSEFVSFIEEPALIQYLKERRLYVNETIHTEEDM